jgi:ABC-type nitrate/sulfonate/bicarbonate transport system substrate-binding protein
MTVHWKRAALAASLALTIGITGVGTGAAAERANPATAAPSGVLAQPQRITITTPSAGLHEMPLVVGLRRGLYAEENLDVTRVQMNPPVSVAAVIAGEGDYTLSVGSVTTAVVSADAPLKIVAGLAVRPLQVMVTADPAVQSVADLRGRSVGTSTLSDTTANLMRLAVRAHGLEPQVDVAIQPLGESPNRLAALQTGQLSAVMLDLAQAKEAELIGGRILVAPTDYPEFPISGIGLLEARLRERPQQTEAVIRASLRAVRYMRENREDLIAMMMDHMGLSRSASEATYDLGIGTFAPDGLMSDTGLQLMIDAARETSGRASSVTPAQLADFSIVRRIGPAIAQ